MLATDGGPNCNPTARSCDAGHCTVNLDGKCGVAASCCDEAQLPQLCLDDQSVITEVTKLKNANIPTFVIGIPGTEAYAGFLDPIADAGGKPDPAGPRRFYQVSAMGGVAGLVDVFREITTQLVRSCEIQLGRNPPDITKVNVALDCELVPQNPGDAGSNWHIDQSTDPNKLIFEGRTCDIHPAARREPRRRGVRVSAYQLSARGVLKRLVRGFSVLTCAGVVALSCSAREESESGSLGQTQQAQVEQACTAG